MKDKIKQEINDLYQNNESESDYSLDDVVDLVFDKTTEAIFEELKKELKVEFDKGNLKHDFIISCDYYLDLKLKEVKEKFARSQISPELPPEGY